MTYYQILKLQEHIRKFYKWHQLSQSKEVEQIRAQAISDRLGLAGPTTQLRVESIFTNKRP